MVSVLDAYYHILEYVLAFLRYCVCVDKKWVGAAGSPARFFFLTLQAQRTTIEFSTGAKRQFVPYSYDGEKLCPADLAYRPSLTYPPRQA